MNLTVTTSPHIRGKNNTGRIMRDVALALLPAILVGVWVHGVRSLAVLLVSVVSCLSGEWLCGMRKRTRHTLRDGSAVVTGLLLGMTLPVTVPYGLVALGGLFATLCVKGLCGGLGQNIFNPALAARAGMLLVAPVSMTHFAGLDGVTVATPLHRMVMSQLPEESLWEMFLGRCPGAMGEGSAVALLLGGAYLVYRRVISVRIPLTYLGTVAVLSLVFSRTGDPVVWMLYSLCSGGVMLGAIFMATDYATSPVTPKGQIWYGIGCGALTVLLRCIGLFPEGVTYAILLMNALAWPIDRYTAPRRFGAKKGKTAV